MGWEEWPVIASIVKFVIKAWHSIFGRKERSSVIQQVGVKESPIFQGPVTLNLSVVINIRSLYVNGLAKSPIEEVKSLFEEGLSRRWKGEYQEAVRLFRKALTLDVNQDEKVALLLLIGACFFEQGQFEEAQGHYREAKSVAEAAKVYQGLAVAMTQLGIMALFGDDVDSAIQYRDRALDVLGNVTGEDSEVSVLRVPVYNLVALIYQIKGESANALDNYQIALDFAKRTGEPLMEVDALFGLALLAYQTRGDWERAADELNKALAVASRSNWCFAEGSILAALAEVYQNKDTRKALALLYKALDIFVKIGNKELENRVIERIADLQRKEHEG